MIKSSGFSSGFSDSEIIPSEVGLPGQRTNAFPYHGRSTGVFEEASHRPPFRLPFPAARFPTGMVQWFVIQGMPNFDREDFFRGILRP